MDNKHITLALSVGDNLHKLTEGLKQVSSPLAELLEARERLIEIADSSPNLTCLSSELDAGSTSRTPDHHALVDLAGGYGDLGSALGALGGDLELVLNRHREALRAAFSAIEGVDETEHANREGV
jgi:hypothetical protein